MAQKKDEKWPSIKDAKQPTSTPVKYDPEMKLFAPQIKEAKKKKIKGMYGSSFDA
jgi:hypothetical protein